MANSSNIQSCLTLFLRDHSKITRANLYNLKKDWAKHIGYIPKDSELLTAYKELLAKNLLSANPSLASLLQTRAVRSQSGVTPLAVMTKPYVCPGLCTFCPLELGMPKSYLSDEPAAQRAKQLDFDPGAQVATRLRQLDLTGHIADKIEIIIVGGTFSAYPTDYRREFVKSIFDALNGVSSDSIEAAHRQNLTARHRVVGLSIETRPERFGNAHPWRSRRNAVRLWLCGNCR